MSDQSDNSGQTREWSIKMKNDGSNEGWIYQTAGPSEYPPSGCQVIEKSAWEHENKKRTEAIERAAAFEAENERLRKERDFWAAHGEVEKRVMKLESALMAKKQKNKLLTDERDNLLKVYADREAEIEILRGKNE